MAFSKKTPTDSQNPIVDIDIASYSALNQQQPQLQALTDQTNSASALVERLPASISTPHELEKFSHALGVVSSLMATVRQTFDPLAKSAHALHRQITTARKDMLAPLQLADQKIRSAMADYHTAIRQAQQSALRKLIDSAAEQQQQQLTVAALELIEQGNAEQAADILSRDVKAETEKAILSAAKPLRTTSELASISSEWSFDIIDQDLISRQFCVPDMQKIRKYVNLHGMSAENAVGGIRVYETSVVRRKGKRGI